MNQTPNPEYVFAMDTDELDRKFGAHDEGSEHFVEHVEFVVSHDHNHRASLAVCSCGETAKACEKSAARPSYLSLMIAAIRRLPCPIVRRMIWPEEVLNLDDEVEEAIGEPASA